MARLILDTAVLIGVERSRKQLDRILGDGDDVAIAAITAAELLVGVELASDAQRARRASFVTSVLETIPIEDYDVHVARTHARLLAHASRSGRSRGAHDLIIAATAATRGRTVVTTDVRGFDDLPGVEVRA